MPIDDTFKWIAEMPSISMTSKDSGLFPALDDSLGPEDIGDPHIDTTEILNDADLLNLQNLDLRQDIYPPSREAARAPSGISIPPPSDDAPTLSSPTISPSSTTPVSSPRNTSRLPYLIEKALAPTPSPQKPRFHTGSVSPEALESKKPMARRAVPWVNIDYRSADNLATAASLSRESRVANPPLPLQPRNQQRGKLSDKSGLHRLEDHEWDMVRDICQYFDEHPNDNVDNDTALNISDMYDAARELRFELPLKNVIVESMIQVGWRVPQYQTVSNPWTEAFKSLDRDIHRREHEQYLIELRHEQNLLAKKLREILLKRNYLQVWKDALITDIQAPDAILASADYTALKLKYLRLWRLRTRVLVLIGQNTDDDIVRTTQRQVLLKLSSQLRGIRELDDMHRELRPKLVLKTAWNMWRRCFIAIDTQKQQAKRTYATHLRSEVFHNWSARYQGLKSERLHGNFLRRKYLRVIIEAMKNNKVHRDQAGSIANRSVLRLWKRRLDGVIRLDEMTKQKKMAHMLLAKFLHCWQSNLRAKQCKDRIERACARQAIIRWRLATKRALLSRYVDERYALNFLSVWRHHLNRIQSANGRTAQIVALSDKECTRSLFRIWRASCRKEILERDKSALLDVTLLKRKGLDILKSRLTVMHDQVVLASGLYRKWLMKKYFRQLRAEGEFLRHARLQALQSRSESVINHRKTAAIVKLWRHQAILQRNLRKNVHRVTVESIKRAVLADWREKLAETIEKESLASELYHRQLLKKTMLLWRTRLDELEELDTAVEDVKIARLGLVMRSCVRNWQLKSATFATQKSQAMSYRQQQLRRYQLSILNVWRERVTDLEGVGDFYTVPDMSITSGVFNSASSPSKFAAISPRFISKWRDRTVGEQSSPLRFSRLASLRTPQTIEKQQQYTPTKPYRRIRRDV